MFAWPVSGTDVSTWGGRQPAFATACVHPRTAQRCSHSSCRAGKSNGQTKASPFPGWLFRVFTFPSDSERRNGRTFDDYGVQVAETIFSVFTSKDGPLDADGRGDAGSAGAAAGALSLFLSLSLTVPVTSIV